MEVILYSTGCPQCMVAAQTMNRKNVEYKEINDKEEVFKVANEFGISSVPFATIDGQLYKFPELMKFLNAIG